MDRVNIIYTYATKMKHSVIRIQTDELNLLLLLEESFEWDQSVYTGVSIEKLTVEK